MPDKPKIKDVVNPFARKQFQGKDASPAKKNEPYSFWDPRRWMGGYGKEEATKPAPTRYEWVIDPATGKPVQRVKRR